MNAFVTDVDAEGVTLKYKSGEEAIESVCKVYRAWSESKARRWARPRSTAQGRVTVVRRPHSAGSS